MPQQLIYTSSPRGLMAGRSGYCIVACSEGMRDALQLSLEQISYYDHLAGTGGGQPVVNAYRILNIRGSLYHVLSRIADAGLDFTKRTNFIAHHLVFQADELLGKSRPPSPAVALLHWDGWCNRWDAEARWLKGEDWGNLFSLAGNRHNPARHWQELTGDAANGLAIWDSTGQEFFATNGLGSQQLLGLLAESLALAAVRPATGGPWEQTFTTFLQERDAVTDFRWRMVQSATTAYDRLAARSVLIKPLAMLRPKAADELAAAFARSGPQPLQITVQPEDKQLRSGQPLELKVVCRGVPPPAQYQWHSCTRTGSRQVVNGATSPELRIENPPRGVSRYVVVIADDQGQSVESRVATIEMELDKVRPAPAAGPARAPRTLRKQASVKPDDGDDELEVRPQKWNVTDTDDEWEEVEAEEEESRKLNWIWIGIAIFLVLFGAMAIFLVKNIVSSSKLPSAINVSEAATNAAIQENGASLASTNATVPATNPPPAATSESAAPQLPPKLALIILEAKVDSEHIAAVTNQIPLVLDQIKSNEEQQEQLTNDIASETKKNEKDAAQNLLESRRSLEARTVELKLQYSKLMSQASSLRNEYNTQKQRADGEITYKLGNLYRLSPGQLPHIHALPLNQSQPVEVTESSPFELAATEYRFQLTTNKNDDFGLAGIEVSKNNLNAPLLVTVATNTNFPGSVAAKLLIWPANISVPAACDDKGNLVFSDTRFLNPLTEFSGPENYSIEINIGYRVGRDYYFKTNFPMIKDQRYVFSDLTKMLDSWKQTLTIVSNIMALRGSPAGSLPTSTSTLSRGATNIWDDLGKICQRFTGARFPYEFSAERQNYAAARDEVRKDLDTQDKQAQVLSALSDENLENLKSFLAVEPKLITFDSVRKRLQYLLPSGAEALKDKLGAGITFKDAQNPGDKAALAQVVFQ